MGVEQKNIEGIMMGLMKQLEKLAPHPDHPEHRGPLFVQIDPQYKPASEHDGMLGSMVLESMLGTAFMQAASDSLGGWTRNVDWSNAAEAASDYIKDRPANNNYRLGQKNAIAGGFNAQAARQNMMDAYLRDLPQRLGIERWLAHYQRKVYALKKHAALAGPSLAA